MDPTELIQVAFRHTIREPTPDAGFERFCQLSEGPFDARAFSAALAFCLREGLIRDPICLPEGALHCHWRLELTPKGLLAARTALRSEENSDR